MVPVVTHLGSKVWVDAAEFTDDLKVGCEVWRKAKDGEDRFVSETEGVYLLNI